MSGMLIFTASEDTAAPVEKICAGSGWECRRGTSIADLAETTGLPAADAVLVDLVNPAPDAHRLIRNVSENSPFMPIILITNDAPAEDFGDGLRYYIDPGHILDLEHILISLACGFSSAAFQPPPRPDTSRVPRVLIVDDNLELANLIERSLRALERFDVRVTGSGFEAASILPMFIPDVVVIDLVLEDMDGREVCAFIRRHDALKNTRIIGVSGYLPEDSAGNKKQMFDAFLEKPFRVKDVVDRILSLVKT